MRARLEKIINPQTNRSFLCYELNQPRFEFFWHFHPEYELTYIVNGRGKRLVGSTMESFNKGDFVLIGPMLPHVWVSEQKGQNNCSAIVIQFSPSFIAPFLSLPEFDLIKSMLLKSARGLSININKDNKIHKMLFELLKKEGVDAVIQLINLLSSIASKKGSLLTSRNYKQIKSGVIRKRINRVLEYVQYNFPAPITILQASKLIPLSESAFCKFFKRNTGKTFTDYVNDVRIAHAADLLIETDQPIGLIATGCGFENMSYFNRIFLQKKKIQPLRYRKMRKNN